MAICKTIHFAAQGHKLEVKVYEPEVKAGGPAIGLDRRVDIKNYYVKKDNLCVCLLFGWEEMTRGSSCVQV